ncbi:GAF and ANTAR domain-containing protein [Streptomyces justiciae]|uniref:GAF and ANTAR domain-containing protein n=1 Tax=Streptomyces justiciae TaxID=2780140 RepID=A0ABU3LUM6_9ACTN|nr:GAF and ANTAR domain-containing protein [Streptomyces justiciae]MDT7842942.1 GAF and ANTAR domain-containing protein [Streptomyces justiciae]
MHHTTRELRLAAALVEAADTLADGFDAGDHLRRVSDHCVELLAARAAGIMLVDAGRAVSFAASSRREEMALDLLQAQHTGGPCLDSYESGEPVPPVSIRVAHADARWPEFTERALRHDIVATFAVPLRRHGTLLGALNVFVPTLPDRTGSPGPVAEGGTPPCEAEVLVAQVLADAAAVGLRNHREFTQYRTLSAQLQEALSSRVRIEQAKGMLAERWGVRADDAFVALRQFARRHRLPLGEVASAVIERAVDDAALREAGGRPPGGLS